MSEDADRGKGDNAPSQKELAESYAGKIEALVDAKVERALKVAAESMKRQHEEFFTALLAELDERIKAAKKEADS